MKTIYDVIYFINKFQPTREDFWCTGVFEDGDRRCALGWCGGFKDNKHTSEGAALQDLFDSFFSEYYYVGHLNDGYHPNYKQPTPKQRVLACLYDIYEKTYGRKYEQPAPEPKERIVYKTVMIDEAVKNLQETLNEN